MRLDLKQAQFEHLEQAHRARADDDGIGFDRAVRPSDASYGLAAMRSRLREGGGELAIRSAPGNGTTITATLPLGAGAGSGVSTRKSGGTT